MNMDFRQKTAFELNMNMALFEYYSNIFEYPLFDYDPYTQMNK